MSKLIIFSFFLVFFATRQIQVVVRRNICTFVVINNISRILFQERAQNVKKILPCDDRLLCELKFIFMTTLHCLICEIDYITLHHLTKIHENLTITKELYMTIASQL